MKDDNVSNYCISCKQCTSHTVLFTKEIDSEDDDFIRWKRNYQVVGCNGCSKISFREEYEDEGMVARDYKGEQYYYKNITTYPYALEGYRGVFDDSYLPTRIQSSYRETINAFKSKCYMLAGVGFRVVIEAICLELSITGNDLKQKIKNLSKGKHITESEERRLHSIRFLGNDSVHEMQKPSEAKLYIVLKIIEHLLWNLYIAKHEIAGLETVVHEYPDFIRLLYEKQQILSQSNPLANEFSLVDIFEKEARRVWDKLSEFETQLIKEINLGSVTFLALGNVKPVGKHPAVQFYTITGVPDYLLDF